MPRWMKVIVAIYAALCLIAVAIGLIGSRGLFGMTPDALAGVWMIGFGLPWSLWALPAFGSSEIASDIAVVACMALNIAILSGIGMLFGRRHSAA